MTVYIITSQKNSNEAKLPQAIASQFPESYLQLNEKSWLLASTHTVREVSDMLGVTDGTNGSAVIAEVGSYFGRANADVWSWIKTKWEATTNA